MKTVGILTLLLTVRWCASLLRFSWRITAVMNNAEVFESVLSGKPTTEITSDEDGSYRTDREVLKTFIETYESLPELWNPTNPNYMHKAKRNLALDKLSAIYKKIKPGATRDDVRKKINTLRCNYRKELKKIVKSIRTGAGMDEVYQPTSWVFYALTFLQKCEQPAEHQNSDLSESQLDDESKTSITQESEKLDGKTDIDEVSVNLQALISQSSRSAVTVPPVKKQKIIESIAKQTELVTQECKNLGSSQPTENNLPSIARVWGEKLLTLDKEQRLYAEKAVNDVLFEASLGNLHRHSVKINEDDYGTVNPPLVAKVIVGAFDT